MSAVTTQLTRTISQLVGFTFKDAKNVAEVGCDLADEGRLEEARMVFEGLVVMNPRDAAAKAALGSVYQKQGRLKDALVAYDAAIVLDGTQPIARANRGELRLRQNDRGGLDDLIAATRGDPSGITIGGRRARALLTAIARINQVAAKR